MDFLQKLFKRAEEIESRKLDTNENMIANDDFFIEEKEDTPEPIPSKPIIPIIEKPKEEHIDYRLLSNSEDFIRGILGDYTFRIEYVSQNKIERFETISKNFTERITHPGLIYYLAYCWGKEIGIVLRPDMIWSCILYEFSKHITETKDKYFDDFNDLYKVEKNAYDGYMSTYDLVDKFRKYVKYEQFYELITKERFTNEPKELTEFKIMSFCNFARIEYKKFQMNCKIPKFQIKGDKDDWLKLISLIDYLSHLIANRFFINYLENIKTIVSNIVANTFQTMLSLPKLRYQGIREMIKDIFYVKDGQVEGWGKELYFDCYMNPKRDWKLDNFNTHIAYIPYVNVRHREACLKAGGLCYSKMDDRNCLEPFYGSMLCKINDVNVFKKLA